MASLPLAACTTGPSEFSDPAVPIEVKVGEEFAIVLESNATTGYRWTLTAGLETSIVRLLITEYRAGNSGGLVGAGGKEYWRFGAEGRGTTLIPMSYTREGGGPTATTAIFTVTVK
jgi:predicted secreted protein